MTSFRPCRFALATAVLAVVAVPPGARIAGEAKVLKEKKGKKRGTQYLFPEPFRHRDPPRQPHLELPGQIRVVAARPLRCAALKDKARQGQTTDRRRTIGARPNIPAKP